MMQSRFWALPSLSLAACSSTEERIDISAEEVIMICRDNVRLNDLHKYRASATARCCLNDIAARSGEFSYSFVMPHPTLNHVSPSHTHEKLDSPSYGDLSTRPASSTGL